MEHRELPDQQFDIAVRVAGRSSADRHDRRRCEPIQRQRLVMAGDMVNQQLAGIQRDPRTFPDERLATHPRWQHHTLLRHHSHAIPLAEAGLRHGSVETFQVNLGLADGRPPRPRLRHRPRERRLRHAGPSGRRVSRRHHGGGQQPVLICDGYRHTHRRWRAGRDMGRRRLHHRQVRQGRPGVADTHRYQ